jgi:hypothetical protein
MSILRPGGTNYMAARDVRAATLWYMEKLGLRKVAIEMDDCEDCVALGFTKEEVAITVGPIGPPVDELTHLLYADNLASARDFLSSRGVPVSETKQDRQGTHYFEMQDLDGNVIEIAEEP